MRFSEMIEGLQILAKYEETGLEAHLNGADHDVVWGSTADVTDEDLEAADDDDDEYELTDTRISAEDAARLKELGWFVDSESESWTHYC